MADSAALALFDPRVRAWFRQEWGEPTPIQARVWPLIAAGEHLLITAPTGSGKTLAAFLWALDRLLRGVWAPGLVRVLYVSPLKALNNDIGRNLMVPLEGIRWLGAVGGAGAGPLIRVGVRSGDTTQAERRRMLRQPPEILITTPESLNLLLSSAGGRGILTGLECVILDEIHAVVGSKRGTHLITAVERLVPLSGEIQRIALSATVRPLAAVAEFVGGRRLLAPGEFQARPVRLVRAPAVKRYDLRVEAFAGGEESAVDDAADDAPDGGGEGLRADGVWRRLAAACRERIRANRSTLLFVPSRALCEKLTRLLNEPEQQPLAYAHHGALSRELRQVVEQKLKAGELAAIVATSSLELGIDIGALDEVILVQAPESAAAAIQRVGRAGHQVGGVSRARFYPTHAHDVLATLVLLAAIEAQEIAKVVIPRAPLDLLAQILVSMVGVEPWPSAALYDQVRCAAPYASLSRADFDRVLQMLSGRFAHTRIAELAPRLAVDGVEGVVRARRGALLALYRAGGTIPNRGYYRLRRADTRALLGELDEEYVWEAKVGQALNLGTQSWRIAEITPSEVRVLPGRARAQDTPFWKGEPRNRDFHLSSRIGVWLEGAEACLRPVPSGEGEEATAVLGEYLAAAGRIDSAWVGDLTRHLLRQRSHTGRPLPHRHHLLLERVESAPGGAAGGHQWILHTLWGGRVNRPYALALEAAWEERFGESLEVFAGDDLIALLLPRPLAAAALLTLVGSQSVERLLRRQLSGSGFFGARFRECAGRALLLTPGRAFERMPLWMSRLRAQKLLDAVGEEGEFPILREAWRSCLEDEFDLPALRRLVAELERGEIGWSEARCDTPSPFARTVAWRQVNQYMYQDDLPPRSTPVPPSDLVREVAFAPDLRPALAPRLVADFLARRRRLAPGSAPRSALEVVEWVKEQWLVPESRWRELAVAMQRDHGVDPGRGELAAELAPKLLWAAPAAAPEPLLLAREQAGWLLKLLWRSAPALRGLDGVEWEPAPAAAGAAAVADAGPEEVLPPPDAAMVIGGWLRFQGPLAAASLVAQLGLEETLASAALEELVAAGDLLRGLLLEGDARELIADRRDIEMLLRLRRAQAAPGLEPRSLAELPLFLAAVQGVAREASESVAAADPGAGAGATRGFAGGPEAALAERLAQLSGIPAPVRLWEEEILPARLPGYQPQWLDQTLREHRFCWAGAGREQILFTLEEDLAWLWASPLADAATRAESAASSAVPSAASLADAATSPTSPLFPHPLGRYPFEALLRHTGLSVTELTERLWREVWAGAASNDSFAALRQGIACGFRSPRVGAPGGEEGTAAAADRDWLPGRSRGSAGGSVRVRGRRRGFAARRSASFSSWRGALPASGNWLSLAQHRAVEEEDLLARAESDRERARLLLERCGILFRELLQNAPAHLQWRRLYRSLRLLELSGEIISGCFFDGIQGLQFLAPENLALLDRRLPRGAAWWLHAQDPASLCGIPPVAAALSLPPRRSGTHLAYRGSRLLLVSRGSGRELTLQIPPEDPDLPAAMAPLQHLLQRAAAPLRAIGVQTINGEPALSSPYRAPLQDLFALGHDHKQLFLRRR
jgi:ATP-dependent Lhr-like helicase